MGVESVLELILMPHSAASSLAWACLDEQTFRSPGSMWGSQDSEGRTSATSQLGLPFSRCRCTASCMAGNTGNQGRSRRQRNDVFHGQGACPPRDRRQTSDVTSAETADVTAAEATD